MTKFDEYFKTAKTEDELRKKVEALKFPSATAKNSTPYFYIMFG